MSHTSTLLSPVTSSNILKEAATPGFTSAIIIIPAAKACIGSMPEFVCEIRQPVMTIIASTIQVPLQAAALAAQMPQAARVIIYPSLAVELPAVSGSTHTGISLAGRPFTLSLWLGKDLVELAYQSDVANSAIL